MENLKLSRLNATYKWAITAFLLLTSLGFSVAGLQSRLRYDFNHEKTVEYYLGDPAEGDSPFPKPLSYLVSVTHVHSFTLPLIFFILWILLNATSFQGGLKKGIILGGVFSILIYNMAPYAVRYFSSHSVFLFTVGGVGLFIFYFFPMFLVLHELWWRD